MRNPSVGRHLRVLWLLGAGVLLALAAPAVVAIGTGTTGGPPWMAVAAQGLLLGTMASNWNVVAGYMGFVDLGHPLYFGVGAYGTAAVMVGFGWGLIPGLMAALVLTGTVALVIGKATLRLHGATFALATLGLLVGVRELVRVAGPMTGGGRGLTLPAPDPGAVYYAAVLLFAMATLLSWQLRHTSLYTVLVAIREDERAAEARGLSTMAWKSGVFAAVGSLTGMAGGLWAYQSTFIDPDLAFAEALTLDVITAALLGGLGTVAGPALGSVLLFTGHAVFWHQFAPYQLLLQGFVLICVVRWLPQGLIRAMAGGDPTDVPLARLRAHEQPPGGAPAPWSPDPPVRRRGADRSLGPPAGGRLDGRADVLLHVRGLRTRIADRPVLDGIDLTLGRCEILGVVGPNGSGKTTLVDCLSRLRPCTADAFWLEGRSVAYEAPHRVARSGLARTFQVCRVHLAFSVTDNLLLAARRTPGACLRAPSDALTEQVGYLLDRLGLAGVAQQRADRLSTGQQRLLEIGMALVLQPTVLVLDEATAGVTPALVETVHAIVRDWSQEGNAVVVVEHDVGVVVDLCHRVMVLDHGRVIAEGSPSSAAVSEAVETAYFGSGGAWGTADVD